MNEKYSVMSPFDITSKMLGPYLFSSTARETLGDKMELYFQDHSFMPMFIQVRTSHSVLHFEPQFLCRRIICAPNPRSSVDWKVQKR